MMQRTAARVGCVGGLEVQRQAAHSGLCMCVKRSRGLRGAVLCHAAAGKQPRTDTPAGPEAEMSLQSPWCCIQGWWGVCFVQLCGIHQPDDSERHRQGAGGHRHGAQAGRAGGALAHYRAGQAPNRARRCVLCPAVDWAPPTGGCRPGVVLATCQMADGSCLGDCKWSAGGRTREATRAIYHQSALLHAQTDRRIVIYERNESRNKSEGVVEVCRPPSAVDQTKDCSFERKAR